MKYQCSQNHWSDIRAKQLGKHHQFLRSMLWDIFSQYKQIPPKCMVFHNRLFLKRVSIIKCLINKDFMYRNSHMLIYPSIFNCSYKYYLLSITLFCLWWCNCLAQCIHCHYLRHIRMNRLSILNLF